MRKYFVRVGATWSIVFSSIVAILYAQGTTHPPQSEAEVAHDVLTVFESFRVVGGLIGMALGLFGVIATCVAAYVFWRVSADRGAREALENTVRAYKGEIDALTMQNKTLQTSNAGLIARIEEKDKMLTDLQKKTDLTNVMETLTKFMTSSEQRYTHAMDIFEKMMEEQVEAIKEAVSEMIKEFKK